LLDFPATEYAIAAACLTGFPAKTSVRILELISFFDEPFLSGMSTLFLYFISRFCYHLFMSKNRYEYKTINGKKQRLHRHIMEEHLGRPLAQNEHIYHLNGDPHDNRLENLVMITKKF
jgi:hypothetical protein